MSDDVVEAEVQHAPVPADAAQARHATSADAGTVAGADAVDGSSSLTVVNGVDGSSSPTVVDGVAVARLYGEPLFALPTDLYIPPDALEVFLEAFEGPLDLLLYLIRRQNFNILDIPMASVTRQYLAYVE